MFIRRLVCISIVPIIAAATLTACRPESPGRDEAVVRDSAGVRIVESSAPAWPDGESWHLSAEPTMEIGVLEGPPEYQLFQVRGAVRFSDGRIVVANGGTDELRIYDPGGRFLTSAGREGSGPGEFGALGSLDKLEGDSLLTWDWRNNRVQIFDSAGNFTRSFMLQPGGEAPGPLQPAGIFDDGSILTRMVPLFTPNDQAGVSRGSMTYMRHDGDGMLLDTIGRFPGPEHFVRTAEHSVSVYPLAFGRVSAIAVAGDGIFFGTGDSYEIEYHSADGELLRIIRLSRPAVPVTAEDRRRFTEETLERVDERWRAGFERALEEMSFAKTMPAYSSLLIDSEGHLWVSDYRPPGHRGPRRRNVFGLEGRFLGPVEIPPRFEVFEIGADYVLGRHSDEMDVERVRLYRLDKPSPITRR